MNQPLLTIQRARPVETISPEMSLGCYLLEAGLVAPWQVFHALERQREWDVTLPEILLARGWVRPDRLREALAAFYPAMLVDLSREPPDPALAATVPAQTCLRFNAIPWQSVGGLLVVATGRPDRFEVQREIMPPILRGALLAISDEKSVSDHLARTHRRLLAQRAETRVDPALSCRGWGGASRRRMWLVLVALALTGLLALIAPGGLLAGLTLWAVISLLAVSALKTCAFLVHFFRPFARPLAAVPPPPPADAVAAPAPASARDSQLAEVAQSAGRAPSPLPRISVMVPLFRETEIARALVSRLSHLSYPKALLDVVLVLEEHDRLTQDTVARTTLPPWMRVVEVPAGSGLTTKPRALNYALDHCRADIIGIWDAEDAPGPDQLDVVAERFANAPEDVVCLQGVLDYYNPWTNWLSRCFTIEYATWFRIILPGLAKLGVPIPLGGTTLFMRRAALEKLGGWDAHNVTEDADLGLRLARFGWRTELIPSVTQEEANCRPVAWIKQRSRWLKGYMATYLVHMQRPARLWRDLGPAGFVGVQLVFFCTLSQFLLAPLIWAFWAGFLGLPYLSNMLLPPQMMSGLAGVFMAIGLTNAAIAAIAVSGQNRTRLMPWVLTMPLYFPLACFAGYKALFELVVRPYYWDKTMHGKTKEGASATHSAVGVLLEPGHESH